MAKKRLGIDALFASTLVPVASPAETGIRQLNIEEITPNPNQPRRQFDSATLSNLIESIRQSGVLQPIIVRELSSRQGRTRYEIVAGERRWRAAKAAGLDQIPAIVRALSDDEALRVALVENLQREDLNPVEETEGYLALLKIRLSEEEEFSVFSRASDRDPYADVLRLLFAMNNHRATNQQDRQGQHGKGGKESKGRGGVNNNVVIKLTPIVEAAFAAIGRTNWLSFIQHRLPLRRLPADLLEALREGRIEYTKARLLGRITGEVLGIDEHQARALRTRFLQQTVEESLSLGALRRLIDSEVGTRSDRKAVKSGAKGEAVPFRDLAHQTATKLSQLKPEQFSESHRRQIQQKLDELRRLIERAEFHGKP